jgi:hypothetical protein
VDHIVIPVLICSFHFYCMGRAVAGKTALISALSGATGIDVTKDSGFYSCQNLVQRVQRVRLDHKDRNLSLVEYGYCHERYMGSKLS